MSHITHFDLETHGTIYSDQQWICDNDGLIARRRDAPIEQLEQNVRYFNQMLKPLERCEISVEIYRWPAQDGDAIDIALRQDDTDTSFFNTVEVELLQGEYIL